MTNRELIALAAEQGATDREKILLHVLEGRAPARRGRVQRRAGVGGWVCSACLLAFILVGYFDPFQPQIEPSGPPITAGATVAPQPAAAPPTEPPPVAPSREKVATSEAPAPIAAPETSRPEYWVKTNDPVVVPERVTQYVYIREYNRSDRPVNRPETSPRPPNPDNGGGNTGGKPENPDTGGGDTEDVVRVHFADFAVQYGSLLPAYLPDGAVPMPFVLLYDESRAVVEYGSIDKGRFDLILYGLKEPAQSQGFFPVSSRDEITVALLQSLHGKTRGGGSYVQAGLNIRGHELRFESSGLSYEEAVLILQSLPIFSQP